MKAGLAGLPGVESVEHTAGTDVFVVRHTGKLERAVEAVESAVLLRRTRRWLAGLSRK